ncbi:helix-turn-helix domain-containing protein [Dactylosporangium sp. CA-233914]|uniref:helix-turn-helix domain-containing protein n=1 Tax=Dactylosporangium sp. CA-233914 TaxID=3239934 RepID=UPI003D90A44F
MRRTPDNLLSTVEAAQILHCSRQHIVDMCTRGELPYTRTGTHRRIPRQAVEQLVEPQPELRRDVERSLWINHALAAKLINNPDGVITAAKERLQFLRHVHSDGHSNPYFDQWQQLLDEGPGAILATMTERSERAAALRTASPLSGLGLLTPEERERVMTSFRAWWKTTNGNKKRG